MIYAVFCTLYRYQPRRKTKSCWILADIQQILLEVQSVVNVLLYIYFLSSTNSYNVDDTRVMILFISFLSICSVNSFYAMFRSSCIVVSYKTYCLLFL